MGDLDLLVDSTEPEKVMDRLAAYPEESEPGEVELASPDIVIIVGDDQRELFDANNQRVFVGLQTPGTTASVEGTPPFRLTIGNATGVELRYQGDTVNLAQRAGANNVARFTLGE